MTLIATQESITHIIQGEHAVSGAPGLVYATILGSCVAACLHDPHATVGGMNHFLLPGEIAGSRSLEGEQYGVHLMELLVNDLMRLGARRDRLQAKLFGGARMVRGLSDIGSQNAEFAENFLRRDGIRLMSKDIGGDRARRIQYWPFSGRARQMYVATDRKFVNGEVEKASTVRVAGAFELF
jgi:chemotaxis protein CheD